MSPAKLTILKSAADLIDEEVLEQVGAAVDDAGRAKGRICGDCRLCCKTLEVPELQKPAGKWCGHAYVEPGGAMCSIYDKRPESCRAFQCMWLKGYFEDRDRPDRTRLVVAEALDELGSPRVAEHPESKAPFRVFFVFEGTRGAVDSSGKLLAQTLLGNGIALAIMEDDGERIRELRFPRLVGPVNNGDTTVKVGPGGGA